MLEPKVRVRNKGWLTEVLKWSVNHKSWLTGFRSFVRIPSTIPTGTIRCCIPNADFFVVQPCRGLFFQKKQVPGAFAA